MNMASPRVGAVRSWLDEDDRALAEIGCWALGRLRGDETLLVIRESIERQKNPAVKQALEYQLESGLFLAW